MFDFVILYFKFIIYSYNYENNIVHDDLYNCKNVIYYFLSTVAFFKILYLKKF